MDVNDRSLRRYHPFAQGTDIIVKSALPSAMRFLHGGPNRDRTDDLTDANRTLSQLSYRPVYPVIIRPEKSLVKGKAETRWRGLRR